VALPAEVRGVPSVASLATPAPRRAVTPLT